MATLMLFSIISQRINEPLPWAGSLRQRAEGGSPPLAVAVSEASPPGDKGSPA